MKAQVFFDERGDEIVAVIETLMNTQVERQTTLLARRL